MSGHRNFRELREQLRQVERGVVRGEAYDPACERIDTAIKAMWLLYRRGKVGLIAERVGLPKREVYERFLAFDLRFIQSERGRITSEKQVFNLIRSFETIETYQDERGGIHVRHHNPLVIAAMHMTAEYIWINKETA